MELAGAIRRSQLAALRARVPSRRQTDRQTDELVLKSCDVSFLLISGDMFTSESGVTTDKEAHAA